MKTYAEVLVQAANAAFSAYLGGSNEIWRQVDFNLIAFIYERPVETVESDCQIVYNTVSNAYYSKFETQGN
jgi:hypothetical protein